MLVSSKMAKMHKFFTPTCHERDWCCFLGGSSNHWPALQASLHWYISKFDSPPPCFMCFHRVGKKYCVCVCVCVCVKPGSLGSSCCISCVRERTRHQIRESRDNLVWHVLWGKPYILVFRRDYITKFTLMVSLVLQELGGCKEKN